MPQEAGFYTRQEILSQPQAWAESLKLLKEMKPDLSAFWQRGVFDHVVFTGCGSTYYAALAIASLWRQLSGGIALAFPASELWLSPEACYPAAGRVLLVAISRSGETSETLHACRAFYASGRGSLLTLSCYPEMPLASMGTLNIVLPSGQEKSIAQTRAFSTLYLAGIFLAAIASGKNELIAGLATLPPVCARVLDAGRPLAELFGRDASLDRFYFLGSGPRFGLACELSLKMKEMSLSHSEPFHFMEFRHGPKSMVTTSTLIVGLRSEANRNPESAVLSEMQAMGARLLVVDDQDATLNFHSEVSEAVRSLLYLPAGQLLAFERSLIKGLNPDRPENLTAVVKLL